MCCLKYEQEAYEDLLKTTPHQGATVKTPDGKGVVESVNLLKGKLRVSVDGEKEKVVKEFDVKEVKLLKNSRKEEADQIDEEILKTLEDN